MAQIPFDTSKKLVCVEYPGILKDSSKVLSTLGGLDVISKTVADPTRRLELRLRPNDVYCKPACADHYPTNNLVLKVRRRKKRGDEVATSSSTSATKAEPIEATIVGIVEKTYKFQSMCDFQFLPAKSKVKRVISQEDVTAVEGGGGGGGDGGGGGGRGGLAAAPAANAKVSEKRVWESLTPQLFVEKLVSSSWLKEPAPLFLPPPIFSRQDTPVEYLYRPEPKHRLPKGKESGGGDGVGGEVTTSTAEAQDDPNSLPVKAPWKAVDEKDLSATKEHVAPNTSNLIGVARQRRAGYTIFVNFEDPTIPSK